MSSLTWLLCEDGEVLLEAKSCSSFYRETSVTRSALIMGWSHPKELYNKYNILHPTKCHQGEKAKNRYNTTKKTVSNWLHIYFGQRI